MNFVIVRDDLHVLLGTKAIQKMGLVSVNKEEFQMWARAPQGKSKHTKIGNKVILYQY